MNLFIEYKREKYSITVIDSIEELKRAVEGGVDIIQFSELERDCGGFMHKISIPGYRYLSTRHAPYGNTFEYEKHCVPNEISQKFVVCFYKANLHGIVNDILYNKK